MLVTDAMTPHSISVDKSLEGWALFWADLEVGRVDPARLNEQRRDACERARARIGPGELATHPPVAEMRRLFRSAGCDPTRYRPSSEALLRRILKGEDLPAIHALVDVNNILSIECCVPCCVMAAGSFHPPLSFRSGRPGESYLSLRGPFRLEGKPLLADAGGPLDCPITGSERVKVTPQTTRAWLVAYLPRESVAPVRVAETLRRIVSEVGDIRIHDTVVT